MKLKVSANLVFCMEDRGIGVRELAGRVPCSPGTISKLCNGLQMSTTERIAKAIERELRVKDEALFVMASTFRVPGEEAARGTDAA